MTRKEIQSALCELRSKLEELESEAKLLYEASDDDADEDLAYGIMDLAADCAKLEDDDERR